MSKRFENVGEFLDNVSDLPVLPANIQKITDLMSDENTSADDISAVVATDQGLSSKVLKIANSAFYGRISQVVKISESVVVIGMSNIKSMLYAIFMDQLYSGGSKDNEVLVDLWKHSISSALMSQKIMEHNNPVQKDAAYTAGLLHDIGELIIFKYEPRLFYEMLSEIKAGGGLTRMVVEETMMGFSHADLGAAMARKWNLPTTIKNGIFFHHSVGDSDVDQMVISAVNVADCFCASAGMGGTDVLPKGKKVRDIIAPEALELFKLDPKKIEDLAVEMDHIKWSAEALMDSMKGGK
jgi:putative nucleotidyltransferase with HDIG domain